MALINFEFECEFCKKPFKTGPSSFYVFRQSKKYCSFQCKRQAHLMQKRCLVCDNTFLTHKDRHFYCSKQCLQTAENRKKKDRLKQEHVNGATAFLKPQNATKIIARQHAKENSGFYAVRRAGLTKTD